MKACMNGFVPQLRTTARARADPKKGSHRVYGLTQNNKGSPRIYELTPGGASSSVQQGESSHLRAHPRRGVLVCSQRRRRARPRGESSLAGVEELTQAEALLVSADTTGAHGALKPNRSSFSAVKPNRSSFILLRLTHCTHPIIHRQLVQSRTRSCPRLRIFSGGMTFGRKSHSVASPSTHLPRRHDLRSKVALGRVPSPHLPRKHHREMCQRRL